MSYLRVTSPVLLGAHLIGGAPGYALQPPQEGRPQRGKKGDFHKEQNQDGLERLNGQGKIRKWSLERPEGEREEPREGKERIRGASRKSLGKARTSDAGENPRVPGEAQPRD